MPLVEALRAQALRLYERYQREFVEALGICPWAERARREGRVRPRVVLDADADVERTVAAVRAFGEDTSIEIGLLIFPRLALARVPFEQFVGRVRERDAEDGPITMALAAFHPEAPADVTEPGRLVPFLRRTPDPTIQVVRLAVLDRVRRHGNHGTGFVDPSMLDPARLLEEPAPLPLHERLAETNLERVRELGVEHVKAVLDDIQRDRDASYARLLR